MKKIKVFIAALLCACCFCVCFAFAGCTNADYMKNSFNCELISSGDSYDRLKFTFTIKVKQGGDYTADYVITKTSKDGKYSRIEAYSKDFSAAADEEYSIDGNVYIYFEDYGKDGYKVELTSLKVYPDNDKEKSVGYAIGFGVLGGVVLCGITAYFIVDKLVLSKKKDD